eukprot:jgi/Tetstr1/420614/TSEL_011702.t1
MEASESQLSQPAGDFRMPSPSESPLTSSAMETGLVEGWSLADSAAAADLLPKISSTSKTGRKRRSKAGGPPTRYGHICGFGSSQPRLEIFPDLEPLTRTTGTTTYGNGRLPLLNVDPLWGCSSPSPDYLNKSGAYRAAAPRENPKHTLYIDVEHEHEATLWRRSRAPRLHNATRHDYSKRIAANIDPYNAAQTQMRLQRMGNHAADPDAPSSFFQSKMGRADVLQRQHFARYWAKGEEERQRSQSAELFDSEWQYQADGSGAQSRPTSACSDWSKLPERFGINLSINLQAVAKFTPSPAPPATRYTPSNPTAPTISEASHAVQSQRPGMRGGLYRDSVAGTSGFTSKSRRGFQDSGEDARSQRAYWAAAPDQMLSHHRASEKQPGPSRARPAGRQLEPGGSGSSGDGAHKSGEVPAAGGLSRPAPLLTEKTLEQWRASMWSGPKA